MDKNSLGDLTGVHDQARLGLLTADDSTAQKVDDDNRYWLYAVAVIFGMYVIHLLLGHLGINLI
jgi:hypothetical protein